MIIRLGRRALEMAVLLFAGLGFVYVPLGRYTGYEHAQAILGSSQSESAGKELLAGARRLRAKLLGEPEPEPEQPARPRVRSARRRAHGQVRAREPHLLGASPREPLDAGVDASLSWPDS